MSRSFSLRRSGYGWSYRFSSPRMAGQSWTLGFWRALTRASLSALSWRRWLPAEVHCDFDNDPRDFDDLIVSLECGCCRTFHWDQPFPLGSWNTDDNEQSYLVCPTHGWQPVWFTCGVLDPDPWYADEPGYRQLGYRNPAPS